MALDRDFSQTSFAQNDEGKCKESRHPEALAEGTTYVDTPPTHAEETSTTAEGDVAKPSCPPLVQMGIDVSSAEVSSEATCVAPEFYEFRGGNINCQRFFANCISSEWR